MLYDYHIDPRESKSSIEQITGRLNHLCTLLASVPKAAIEDPGRNLFSRSVDATLRWLRIHVPPLHWIGATSTALLLYLYLQLVARTSRLTAQGDPVWPKVPPSTVLALWHRDAPSLLVAIGKCRPQTQAAIMIANDPRGDYLALLCRFVGLRVVRGDSEEGGWEALSELAQELLNNSCVILTADGGGPAFKAKIGAVALAGSARVSLIPLSANCRPALEETHKWDAARNPLPFCSLTILMGESRKFDSFSDLQSIEVARSWLEETLNEQGIKMML